MSTSPYSPPADLAAAVDRALAEDIGDGDLTAALIPADRMGRATVITREAAVLCGVDYVNYTFNVLDPRVRVEWQVAEGAPITANQPLFVVSGPARALLTGERTALNFLQFLSGTATAAHAYAAAIEGTACRVLDTRKTVPGLRLAQKYAVQVGGGKNHRVGLYDGILIKENHIVAAGSIALAVQSARASGGNVPVEVEVENLDELRQAIAAAADIVMLDEFSMPDIREAVTINRTASCPVKLEASGGVSLQSIRAIAETGVDYISVGSITKHVCAVDLSMRFEWQN